MERAREGAFNHLWSLALPRRGEATVGNMNYEMIRGCKMEINPGDYTAQYLPIRFLRQWFLIVVVWRTASLIIPPVWSAAGEGIVMIEFLWTWLRRQLHFASHFQDFVFRFFFQDCSFFSSFSDGRKFRPHQTLFVFFSHPLGRRALQKAQEITRGKT